MMSWCLLIKLYNKYSDVTRCHRKAVRYCADRSTWGTRARSGKRQHVIGQINTGVSLNDFGVEGWVHILFAASTDNIINDTEQCLTDMWFLCYSRLEEMWTHPLMVKVVYYWINVLIFLKLYINFFYRVIGWCKHQKPGMWWPSHDSLVAALSVSSMLCWELFHSFTFLS